ncbi:MAG: DMT family transporter [Alphaproteobacteria bacterium]|nr:MAG: DMT family transporter [Alphaproteobacteria bacterium]
MTRLFRHTSPVLVGASLMVLAGLTFALVNTLLQYGTMVLGVSPTRLAFWQYLIAFLFSLPWVLSRGWRSMRSGQLLSHVIRVALAATGVQLWVLSLAHVPIWQAIALIMLSPFFVIIGANLFLGERASIDRWAAVFVGFAGGMIILAPWSDAFSYYVLLPVMAAAMWAMTSLMTKHLSRTESPEALTVYLLLLLTPINAALAMGEGLSPGVGLPAMLLIAAGLLTALAQYAIAKAYSLADASFLQPFDHLKLPFNVVLGLAAFGFVPPGSMWLGSLLIIGASFLLLHKEWRRTPPAKEIP